jgi:hypothetical protein
MSVLLLAEISEKDQQTIRETREERLSSLHFSLGTYIRNRLGLGGSNEELLKACCPDSSLRNADSASMLIIKALWQRLQPVQMVDSRARTAKPNNPLNIPQTYWSIL